jgi:hypothetical protein
VLHVGLKILFILALRLWESPFSWPQVGEPILFFIYDEKNK